MTSEANNVYLTLQTFFTKYPNPLELIGKH